MNIKQLRRLFNSELSHIYPKTEIDSFFYILAEDILNLKRVDIALQLENKIEIPQKFHTALNDLIDQKPIQYILKKTEFYGLEFKLNNNVLIPRPETEELVDWIINDQKEKPNLNVLDIGTGSGCIAISLAKNLNNPIVTAIDISEEAIKIAKENSLNNNTKVSFVKDNILNSKFKPNTKFNIIVSNPPYVRELEKAEIQENVLNNEPHLALFVDDDNPLIFYNAIADFAIKNLSKNGVLYLEINQYLAKETVNLLKDKGFNKIKLKKDIFNNNRMIKAVI